MQWFHDWNCLRCDKRTYFTEGTSKFSCAFTSVPSSYRKTCSPIHASITLAVVDYWKKITSKLFISRPIKRRGAGQGRTPPPIWSRLFYFSRCYSQLSYTSTTPLCHIVYPTQLRVTSAATCTHRQTVYNYSNFTHLCHSMKSGPVCRFIRYVYSSLQLATEHLHNVV